MSVVGSVVLLRMADQYTLAAVSAVHDADTCDLRAFALYADGHLGVVEIARSTRGDGVSQWQAPPWPPAPALDTVASQLMPASRMPPLPTMPLMVIVTW